MMQLLQQKIANNAVVTGKVQDGTLTSADLNWFLLVKDFIKEKTVQLLVYQKRVISFV